MEAASQELSTATQVHFLVDAAMEVMHKVLTWARTRRRRRRRRK